MSLGRAGQGQAFREALPDLPQVACAADARVPGGRSLPGAFSWKDEQSVDCTATALSIFLTPKELGKTVRTTLLSFVTTSLIAFPENTFFFTDKFPLRMAI